MKLLFSLSVLLSLVSSIVHADNDLRPRPMNQLRQEVEEVDAENEEAARSSSKTTNSLRVMEDVSTIDFNPQIVGGDEVNPPFKYPFMVNAGGCGASLVAPNVLLSAAHCGNGYINQVKIGRHNLNDSNEDYETFNVVEEVPHPNYNEATLDYDYMMLKLDGSSSRTPVQLDTGDDTSLLDAGNDVIVMGWGTTSSGGSLSNVLLEVEVDVISQAQCQDAYSNPITERMVCAARTGKDSCQGDSGGPIIDKATGKQIGVVSWGIGCANSNYPGVYAKVRDQIGWIQEYIDQWSLPDDTPTTSPTECAGLELSVALLTDGYGNEVTWNVNKDGLAILSSDGETYGNNQEYIASTCVLECDGEYTFSIFDSYGDGLGWGEPGSYTVTLGEVVKAQGGGDYGFEDIKYFSGCDDKVNGIDHDVQSLTYNSLNFGPSETTKSVQLRYAKGDNGGKLELRIGGPTGTLIAEYSPTMTGNWDTFTTVNIDIDDVIGIQDLTLVVKGVSTVMNIDWFELSA